MSQASSTICARRWNKLRRGTLRRKLEGCAVGAGQCCAGDRRRSFPSPAGKGRTRRPAIDRPSDPRWADQLGLTPRNTGPGHQRGRGRVPRREGGFSKPYDRARPSFKRQAGCRATRRSWPGIAGTTSRRNTPVDAVVIRQGQEGDDQGPSRWAGSAAGRAVRRAACRCPPRALFFRPVTIPAAEPRL